MLLEKMKILFIDRYYYPDWQGTACILSDLCAHLSGRHQITVICGNPSWPSSSKTNARLSSAEGESRGVQVTRVFCTNFGKKKDAGRLSNYASFLSSALLKALTCQRPDLVVVMTSPPLVSLVALCIKKIKRVPFVIICQDLFPETAIVSGALKKGTVSRICDFLNTFSMRNALSIVTISQLMKAKVQEKGIPSGRITVIPNWTNSGYLKPLPKNNHFSRRYGLEDKFVVMSAGNIGLSHNLNDVLSVVKGLETIENLCFLVMGEGSGKADAVSLAERAKIKNALFLPLQEQGVLNEALASADVFLIVLKKGLGGYTMPSRIYSYLAVGRAVIAVVDPHSEIAELIQEAGCGVVIPPDDLPALSSAISILHRNPKELEKYSNNALVYSRQKSFMLNGLKAYSDFFANLPEKSSH